MAGGEYAAILPCLRCAGPADRIFEGLEDDHYRCRECHAEFAVDWSYDGPPKTPCWSISEEEAEECRQIARKRYSNKKNEDRRELKYVRPERGIFLTLIAKEENRLSQEKEREKVICPMCNSDKVAHILYGYPSFEGLEKAEKGELYLGGCTLGDHFWHCRDCRHEW